MLQRKILNEAFKHQKIEQTDPATSVEIELKDLPILPTVTLSKTETKQPSTMPASSQASSDIKHELSQSSAPLRYLDGFTPEQLTDLEKKYGKPAQALESVIDDYWKSYWVELTANYVGIATNLLYMVFQATAIKAGIDGSVKILNPEAYVPESLSTGLGGVLAGGGLVFIFSISAKNEAVKAILDYSIRDPLDKRINDALKFAANNKARAFIDSFKVIAHQSVLLGTYMTGALSEILPIIDYLNSRTSFEKWLAIAAIQYFCCRYSSSYATPSYYEGVKFWENKEGRPYLAQELLKGNIATPFQVFFQGIISSSLLRAFPNYFWVAATGAQAIGGWPPAALITFLVFINSLCSLYPATYNHYMSDGEKIDAILKNNINWDTVKQLAQQQYAQLNIDDMNPTEFHAHLDRIVANLIQSEKQTLRTMVESKKGIGYTFKEEPSTAVTTTWQCLIGAYFGSQFLAPMLTPLTATPPGIVAASCGLLCAAGLGGLFGKAESNRVSDRMVLTLLQAKENEKIDKQKHEKEKTEKPADEIKLTPAVKFLDSAAALITAMNSISGITSTIGASSKIHSTTLETTFAAATATQSGLNSFFYNYKKVRDTLRSLFAPKPKDEIAAESIDEWHEASVKKNNEVETKTVERPTSPASSPSALFATSRDEWVEVDPERSDIELISFR